MLPVVSFLIVAFHLAVVALLVWRRHTHPAGWTYAWFVLAAGIWSACIAGVTLHPGLAITLWLIRASHVSGVLICIAGLWFCCRFPTYDPRFHRVAWLFTATAIPWLGIAWGHWLIAGMHRYPGGEDVIAGPLLPIYTIWLILGMGAGIGYMAWKVRESAGIERLQLYYVLLGAVGLGVIGVCCTLLIPMATGSFNTAAYSPLASVFFISATTYAIIRYHLMDMQIVLRAGVVYSVTLVALSLVFALLNGALMLGFTSHTTCIIIAIIGALIFQPMRNAVQRVIDRYFFKGISNYRQVLHEVNRMLTSARDEITLFTTLGDVLARTLHPVGVAVLTAKGDSFVLVSQTGQWRDDLPTAFPEHHPLLIELGQLENIYVVGASDPLPASAISLQELLEPFGVQVVVPLTTSGQVDGLVLLGQKQGSGLYTADDLALLRILGSQMAIVLENLHRSHDLIRLQEAGRLRSQLLSYISHELKTPLTPIISGVELLQPGMLGPVNDRQLEVVSVMQRQAKRLHHLINDLLDLFQLESGGMVLRTELVALAPLISQSLAAYEKPFHEKNLYLRAEVEDDLPLVQVDALRFGQILDNLLDNARKFTDQGGVNLTARHAGNQVRITVTDTGIGLTPQEAPRIFEQSYQVQRHRRQGGAGLGLAIVKHLVEAHEGTICVESAGLGCGSSLILQLPVAQEDVPAKMVEYVAR